MAKEGQESREGWADPALVTKHGHTASHERFKPLYAMPSMQMPSMRVASMHMASLNRFEPQGVD